MTKKIRKLCKRCWKEFTCNAEYNVIEWCEKCYTLRVSGTYFQTYSSKEQAEKAIRNAKNVFYH